MKKTDGEAELLLAARDDVDAFAEVYRTHVNAVTSYVARRTTNAQEVADIVASTFLEAIRSLDSYDPKKGTPFVWLLGIAHRVMYGIARRKGRDSRLLQRLESVRTLGDADVEQLEDRIDALRIMPSLTAALQQLPLHQREALMLIGVDKLSLVEAARVQGIHPAAFRMRLSRARRALRGRMDGPGEADSFLSADNTITSEVEGRMS